MHPSEPTAERSADTAKAGEPGPAPESEPEPEPEPEPPTPARQRDRLSARVNFWSTVLTALTAIAALVLSLITYVQLNFRADIEIAMPGVLRVASARTVGAWGAVAVVIAPTFSVNRKTDVQAFVTSARLELRPPDGSPDALNVSAPWFSVVEFELKDGRVSVANSRDASPILVSAESPPSPAMQFVIDIPELKGFLVPGRWNARLVVDRLGDEPSVQDFCLFFPQLTVDAVNAPLTVDATSYAGFQPLYRGTPTSVKEADPSCYVPR